MNSHRSDKARTNILNKIYTALNKTPIKDITKPQTNDTTLKYQHLFVKPDIELDVLFAKEFFEVGGKFVYCADENECFQKLTELININKWNKIFCRENILIQKLNKHNLDELLFADLSTSNASITGCEFLIARTGSIVISSFGNGDRTSSAYSPIHICIAYNYQLVYDLSDALHYYKKSYSKDINEFPSFFSIITGPSKTADIEKTLVRGVHGPEDIYIFFIDQ